jgi:hypothetical protein
MPALPTGALAGGALQAGDVIVGKFREFVGVRTYLADRFLLQFHAKLVGLIKDRSRLALKACFLVQSHQ